MSVGVVSYGDWELDGTDGKRETYAYYKLLWVDELVVEDGV